jgi:hypothetical protein
LRRLRSNGVGFRPLSIVTGVDGTTVRLADAVTGEPVETEADLVVVQTTLTPADGLVAALDGAGRRWPRSATAPRRAVSTTPSSRRTSPSAASTPAGSVRPRWCSPDGGRRARQRRAESVRHATRDRGRRAVATRGAVRRARSRR